MNTLCLAGHSAPQNTHTTCRLIFKTMRNYVEPHNSVSKDKNREENAYCQLKLKIKLPR